MVELFTKKCQKVEIFVGKKSEDSVSLTLNNSARLEPSEFLLIGYVQTDLNSIFPIDDLTRLSSFREKSIFVLLLHFKCKIVKLHPKTRFSTSHDFHDFVLHKYDEKVVTKIGFQYQLTGIKLE